MIVNHIGLCVTDVERARRFYESAFGFTFTRELHPPDEFTAPLLGVEPPVNLHAVYLALDGFTLELLAYARSGQSNQRQLNEPGLTHLSLTTPDLSATLVEVVEHGGTIVESSNIGLAVMVRDPDGQLIELLPARR
jgi:catechol 2,3-dioxygenase-like lactoylglutathione lyase family enzyme